MSTGCSSLKQTDLCQHFVSKNVVVKKCFGKYFQLVNVSSVAYHNSFLAH